MLQTTMQTITGQCLDMRAAPTSGVDFTHYTITKYNAIVKWKTAFYSFYLPVACAMYLVGEKSNETYIIYTCQVDFQTIHSIISDLDSSARNNVICCRYYFFIPPVRI